MVRPRRNEVSARVRRVSMVVNYEIQRNPRSGVVIANYGENDKLRSRAWGKQ